MEGGSSSTFGIEKSLGEGSFWESNILLTKSSLTLPYAVFSDEISKRDGWCVNSLGYFWLNAAAAKMWDNATAGFAIK